MFFGKKSSVPTMTNIQPLVLPVKRAIVVTEDYEEILAYDSLCKKIGVNAPYVRLLLLEYFFADRGIPVYDNNEVHQHLVSLGRSSGRQHLWKPLRKSDMCCNQNFIWWFDEDHSKSCDSGIYKHLVPGSVLETVSTILDTFPDANFLVSEIVKVSDPFLAVTFPGQRLIIVDFWNEPGFRPTTYKETALVNKLTEGTEVKEWAKGNEK